MSATELDEQLEPQTDETPDAEQEDDPEQIDGPDNPEPPEPEPEPDPEQQESQARMEDVGKKLDGLTKHVAKRMGEILGEDATLYQPCPCCTNFQTPGWVPPIDPPADVRAEIAHYMGQFAETDYKPDNYSRVCDECGGLGETLTGSKVPNQGTLTCIPCKGRGWVPVGAERGGAGPIPDMPTNGDALHSPEGELLTPAVSPQDSEEVAALKARGYVVISPPSLG